MEEVLRGGVANAGAVVRRGDFVLRPSNEFSPFIHEFLLGLWAAGFDGAPLPVEIQEDGRERLHFVEGDVPLQPYPQWAQTNEALSSTAALLRSFHEASARVEMQPGAWSQELADPQGGPIICHNDVCLENVVFRDGKAIAFLDFDFAAPGRPTYDLAALARMCVPIDDDTNATRQGFDTFERPRKLRLVADAYGLDAGRRFELIDHLDRTMHSGGEFVRRRAEAGDPNFIKMLADMGGMTRFERRRDWWSDARSSFVAALA